MSVALVCPPPLPPMMNGTPDAGRNAGGIVVRTSGGWEEVVEERESRWVWPSYEAWVGVGG